MVSGFACYFWVGVLRVLQMFLGLGWFNPENEERRVGRVFVERESLRVNFLE